MDKGGYLCIIFLYIFHIRPSKWYDRPSPSLCKTSLFFFHHFL